MTLGRADADMYLRNIGARFYKDDPKGRIWWVPRMRQYALDQTRGGTATLTFHATCPCSG